MKNIGGYTLKIMLSSNDLYFTGEELPTDMPVIYLETWDEIGEALNKKMPENLKDRREIMGIKFAILSFISALPFEEGRVVSYAGAGGEKDFGYYCVATKVG